jgi:hypothetical protein
VAICIYTVKNCFNEISIYVHRKNALAIVSESYRLCAMGVVINSIQYVDRSIYGTKDYETANKLGIKGR